MQRCLAKAISLHGIGLYIYQGEGFTRGDVLERIENIYKEQGVATARQYFNGLNEGRQKVMYAIYRKN